MYYAVFSRTMSRNEIDGIFEAIKVYNPGFLGFGYDMLCQVKKGYNIRYINIDTSRYEPIKCASTITVVDFELENPGETIWFFFHNPPGTVSEEDAAKFLDSLLRVQWVLEVGAVDSPKSADAILADLVAMGAVRPLHPTPTQPSAPSSPEVASFDMQSYMPYILIAVAAIVVVLLLRK